MEDINYTPELDAAFDEYLRTDPIIQRVLREYAGRERLRAFAQHTAAHKEKCPAAQTTRMLRWEKVDLSRCTCLPLKKALAAPPAAEDEQ